MVNLDGESVQIREVTVKSLSMAMGIRQPGFQLLSLVPPSSNPGSTFADSLCVLPDQLAIYLSVYIPLLLLSLFIVLVSNAVRMRASHLRASSHSGIAISSLASSSSAPLSRSARLRQEVERGDDGMSYDVSLDGDEYPEHTLPPPALYSHKKRTPWFTRGFVLLGRQRRITISAESLKSIWEVGQAGSKGRGQHGFLGGCIRDVRDVAVFPLTIFVLVSGWMCI